MNSIEQLKQAKIEIGRAVIHLIHAEVAIRPDRVNVKAAALNEYVNAIHLLNSVIEELSHDNDRNNS